VLLNALDFSADDFLSSCSCFPPLSPLYPQGEACEERPLLWGGAMKGNPLAALGMTPNALARLLKRRQICDAGDLIRAGRREKNKYVGHAECSGSLIWRMRRPALERQVHLVEQAQARGAERI